MREKNSSFRGLIPFIIFILIYLGTGIYLQSIGVEKAFYVIKGPVAVFISLIVAFIIFRGKISEKMSTFLEGCGHVDIMTMCIIYLLAGAFASVSKEMGGVDEIVNLGMTYIPSKYIIAGLFIISSFISTSTGTSVGAIVALGPIAVGLGEKSGISMALTLATLMCGAMFGDNLSVISDTTIAATRTQGVEMKDKFRVNLYIAIPPAIITLILLIIFGKPDMAVQTMEYSYNLIKILPYIFVLIFAVCGMNVFYVLTIGVLLSGGIGIYYGDFTLITLGEKIYSGFADMNDIFLLSLLTGGMANMVRKEGGINWIIKKITGFIVGRKSAKFAIGTLVAMTDIAVANNTVAILINGDIAREIAEKYDVDFKESAAILDIFSCVFQGLIPYGAQMLILLGFTGGIITPLDIIPLLWYQQLLFLFTIIAIFFPFYKRFLKIK